MQRRSHANIAVLKLIKLNIVLFLTISVLLYEMLTSLMNILLRGRITDDYLITGGVVSSIASAIVMYLIRHVVRSAQGREGLQVSLKERVENAGRL